LVIFKKKFFDFVHTQWPHIFASTLSDFFWWIRMAETTNFSFAWIWCFHSLHMTEVPCCVVVSNPRSFHRSWQPHELWFFQMCDWIGRI
jgi:hypothetical protein